MICTNAICHFEFMYHAPKFLEPKESKGLVSSVVREPSFWQTTFTLTKKYPLPRYILGVLTHTTNWDCHLGCDETLKWVISHILTLLSLVLPYYIMCAAWLLLTSWIPELCRGVSVTKDTLFFYFEHIKSNFIIDITIAGIGSMKGQDAHERKDRCEDGNSCIYCCINMGQLLFKGMYPWITCKVQSS